MGRVAAVTKIDGLARRLLRRRSVRKKLLGLVTLGQLRDRLECRACARSPNPGTRCCHSLRPGNRAHRPGGSRRTVVSLIVGHLNWPAAKIASISRTSARARIRASRARPAASSRSSHRPGLIPFLAVCNYSTALPTVRRILREPHIDEVLAPACT